MGDELRDEDGEDSECRDALGGCDNAGKSEGDNVAISDSGCGDDAEVEAVPELFIGGEVREGREAMHWRGTQNEVEPRAPGDHADPEEGENLVGERIHAFHEEVEESVVSLRHPPIIRLFSPLWELR